MTQAIVVHQEGKAPLYVLVNTSVEIGRECDGLIVLDDRVSRRHLRIDAVEGRLSVTDLGSRNGTVVDGKTIEADRPVTLAPTSSVVVGSTTIRPYRLPVSDEPDLTGRATVTAPIGADGSGPAVRPRPEAQASATRTTSIETLAGAASRDAPRLMARAIAADETVTIMFSDIEASTELALSMGDAQWMAVLHDHNDIFRRRVGQYGGAIIKNQGDGFMLSFPSARRALLCGAHIQHDLQAYAATHPDKVIRVRMGCHTGEAIHRSGDLFGRHVIIAARVADLADGAQINVSSIAKEITAARGDLSYGPPIDVQLKGVDGVHRIYQLDWARAPINAARPD